EHKMRKIFVNVLLACFSVILIASIYSCQKGENKKISPWMQHVNSRIGTKTSGKFLAKDKHGMPVIFEWEKVLFKEKGFGDNMKQVTDLLCQVFADVELEKLRTYPEQTKESVEIFFKDKKELQDLITKGIVKECPEKGGTLEIVNEDLYKPKMIEKAKIFYNSGQATKTCGMEDIAIFVKVKDEKTKKLLGYAIFSITDDSDYGNVFLWNMALETKSQGRGLGRLLTSSVFKILPDIKQIGLGVYSSNERAIGAYKAWGFGEKKEPTEAKEFRSLHMDYFAEKSDILQKTATNLKPIILETERLYFRPFVKDDLEKLIALYTDKEVVKHIKEPIETIAGKKLDRELIKEMLNFYIEHQKNHGYSYWAAFEKETGDFVGRIGLRKVYEKPNTADVGYVIHKKYWGKGYATESMKGIINGVFAHTDIKTILAITTPEHKASRRVMEKVGMKFAKELEMKGIKFVLYKITKQKK
ncbi:GNAT family N-acetyltransferase, partial [Candidatus Dependentiae bacterium]